MKTYSNSEDYDVTPYADPDYLNGGSEALTSMQHNLEGSLSNFRQELNSIVSDMISATNVNFTTYNDPND